MRLAALFLILACLTGCGATAPGGQGLENWVSGRDRQVQQDVAAILRGMQNARDRARDLATTRIH